MESKVKDTSRLKKKIIENVDVDLDEKVIEVLHLISNSAQRRDKPAFLYFEKGRGEKPKGHLIYDFNKLMDNVGGEQYSFESFEDLYNSNETVKSLVDDYSEDGVTVNSPETLGNSDTDPDDTGSSRRVSAAAKRSTNRAMKKK